MVEVQRCGTVILICVAQNDEWRLDISRLLRGFTGLAAYIDRGGTSGSNAESDFLCDLNFAAVTDIEFASCIIC